MSNSKIIVIFTEGETDEVFFKKLIEYLRTQINITPKVVCKNLKGVCRYEQKAPAKIKHEIINKHPEAEVIVFCSYDKDVFDIPFHRKPPVDWEKVEKKLLDIGVKKVFHIKADKMIEDWFLSDIENLCKFLKIKVPKKISGKNAFEKLKTLFKRGNKIYQKGYNTNNFVENLSIANIYNY